MKRTSMCRLWSQDALQTLLSHPARCARFGIQSPASIATHHSFASSIASSFSFPSLSLISFESPTRLAVVMPSYRSGVPLSESTSYWNRLRTLLAIHSESAGSTAGDLSAGLVTSRCNVTLYQLTLTQRSGNV